MTALIELTVQFSAPVFRGEERSGVIIVTVDLIGGTASHDFSVVVNMSSGSPLVPNAIGMCNIVWYFLAVQHITMIHIHVIMTIATWRHYTNKDYSNGEAIVPCITPVDSLIRY